MRSIPDPSLVFRRPKATFERLSMFAFFRHHPRFLLPRQIFNGALVSPFTSLTQ